MALAAHRPGPERKIIAVAGDSAGGGLTVALLVATRDAGEALPAAAVLMSPTVDLTSSGASMTERADQDPISTPAMLRQFASDYLAGADPKTPLASPLFASLAGLPPLLMQVGTADLLLSDSERLATAAAQAGVDVTLEIGEGLPHVYQLMLGTPEAAEATEQIGKFLRARFPNRIQLQAGTARALGHAVTMNKPTQGAEDDDAGCAHPLHGGAGRGRCVVRATPAAPRCGGSRRR